MLRRLKVRTRLVAVVALPLAALLVLAAPGLLDHRARATDAARTVAVARSLTEVVAGLDAVEAERTWSAAARAGAGRDLPASLRDQRERTDAALRRAETALTELSGRDAVMANAVADVRVQLVELRSIRAATDATTAVVAWVDPFGPLAASLLRLQDEAGVAAADLGTGDALVGAALLARAKEAASLQDAELAAATAWEELNGDQAGTIARLRSEEAALTKAHLALVPAVGRRVAQDALIQEPVVAAGRFVDRVVADGELGTLDEWLSVAEARQADLHEAQLTAIDGAALGAERAEASERSAAATGLALVGGALALTLLLGLLVGRSINRPLRELRVFADRLAVDRLPQLVEALRHPTEDQEQTIGPVLAPIEVWRRDDLGRLAESFNSVQAVVVEAAAEQSKVLKRGISELYVNLARRNQALIERQIHLLDELERGEQDAQVLQHLYSLDHLATRMRRNAESLLVLAGSEPGRRRTTPIGVTDVVRAALSEIEDYPRVELGLMAPATLYGPAVTDVAHLLAELLENATQLSPPTTSVRVEGAHSADGYRLVIADEGVGMREEQLAELNAMFREPPVTGLAVGRSLGCLVAARLAARHGISVQLAARSSGGIEATVVLPEPLLAAHEPVEWAPPVAARTAPLPPVAVAEAPPPVPAPSEPLARTVVPTRLQEALPTHAAFDADIRALLDGERTEPAPLGEPSAPEPVSAGAMVDGSTGLRRRRPGATMEVLPEVLPKVPNAPARRRSPDEVRGLLTRYRSGLVAGRHAAGSTEEEHP